MQWSWLVSPLAGSIIGYGTNYLAIKMLFRPHDAKYIGTMKVPFTPGLIPKEKGTLARQIGETVEEHLLNEDVLIETLTGPKAKEAFSALMAKVPEYMEHSDKTINQLMEQLLGVGTDGSLETLMDQFVVEIITMLRSEEVIQVAIPYIAAIIADVVDEYIANMSSNPDLTSQIEQIGKDVLASEKAKEDINKALDELEEKAYGIVQDNASAIGKSIIKAVAQGEEAERIKATIQQWAEENFNPMVLMFVKIDKIYEGIMDYAYGALDDTQQTDKFSQLLCKIIKDLLHEEFGVFIKEEDYEGDYKNKVMSVIYEQVNPANINMVIQTVQKELSRKEDNKKVHIERWLYKEWDGYVNTPEIFELGKKILQALAGFVGGTSLANLSMIIPKGTHEQIQERLFEFYIHIMTTNSKTIVDVMDISALVESKINEFSSQEAEDIILSVVKNQLRGITWIGAILGFVIGFIPNFIR